VALSIDAMLPALGVMGRDLSLAHENDAQLVVGVLFAGMTVGQAVAGPLSDSWGRKRPMYLGLAIFAAGSLLAMVATSFLQLLAGRALQGLGASAPRVLSNAIVRDHYTGAGMARVLSLITTIFIVVPIVAPVIGQAILAVANWRAIFGYLLLQGLVAFLWFALRQPETLPAAHRVQFSLRVIARAGKEIIGTRISLGYTLVAGLSTGGFIGYLSSSRQILQDQYRLGAQFPLYFGALAFSIGLASFANSRLVVRVGMKRLVVLAQTTTTVVSLVFLGIAFAQDGHPPLWQLMSYLLVTFFCLGILLGNCTARAMEPLGHIAGTASAFVTATTTLISVCFGIAIGRAYDGTILPLVLGFGGLGALGQVVLRWTERAPRRT